MAPRTSELPLGEYQELVRATSVITELVVLDRAWTREAEASSNPEERDDTRVEELGGIVNRLDRLYGDIGELSPRLHEIFQAREPLLRQRYEALIADDVVDQAAAPGTRSLAPDERRKFRALVQEYGDGDIVALATRAASEIGARSTAERQNIRTEYDGIRAGTTSDGDMDPEFEFWLQAVALAATIALGPEAGGVVELIGGLISWLVG
jgi:hypothetical protein